MFDHWLENNQACAILQEILDQYKDIRPAEAAVKGKKIWN